MSVTFIKAIKGKETSPFYKAKVLANDLKAFNKLLQAPYSDEWVAVYQYSIEGDYLNKMNFAGRLSDKAYNQIVKELNIHVQEEFNHAKLIVPELIKIGSEPIYQMDMLQLTANAPLAITEKEQDTILNQAIAAEEGAIKVYSEIIKFITDTKCTGQKFKDTVKFILEQEHEHKSDLEKLLKEFKGK